MSPLHFRQAHWMRALLRVLVLCFALCTMAMAGHTHQTGQIENHHTCDLCTAFGGLIDTPPLAARILHRPLADAPRVQPATGFIATRVLSTAQARAPPLC